MRNTSTLALVFCCLSLSPIAAGRQDAAVFPWAGEFPDRSQQTDSEWYPVHPVYSVYSVSLVETTEMAETSETSEMTEMSETAETGISPRPVMPNPYDAMQSTQPAERPRNIPPGHTRPVMANPYDRIQEIRQAQKERTHKNSTIIETLAAEALSRGTVTSDPSKIEITQLLQQPEQGDTAIILDLLNHDATRLEVERIPLENVFNQNAVFTN